jgi:hypothetical protein
MKLNQTKRETRSLFSTTGNVLCARGRLRMSEVWPSVAPMRVCALLTSAHKPIPPRNFRRIALHCSRVFMFSVPMAHASTALLLLPRCGLDCPAGAGWLDSLNCLGCCMCLKWHTEASCASDRSFKSSLAGGNDRGAAAAFMPRRAQASHAPSCNRSQQQRFAPAPVIGAAGHSRPV